jgi:hypothetical protein
VEPQGLMSVARPFSQEALYRLWQTYAPENTTKDALLQPQYLLAAEGRYRVYFAPLGTFPENTARVILVGLTPGLAQAQLAAKLFLSTPADLHGDEIAFGRMLREHVAFGGPMRGLLCSMLDQIGFPGLLGVSRSEELFDARRDDVATTSALVYPVLTGSDLRNFSGTVNVARLALFRQMLTALLAPRLAAAPDALIIPLGKAASSGVRYLVNQGAFNEERVLWEFPHPSGANGHRVRLFEHAKEGLRVRCAAWLGAQSRPAAH